MTPIAPRSYYLDLVRGSYNPGVKQSPASLVLSIHRRWAPALLRLFCWHILTRMVWYRLFRTFVFIRNRLYRTLLILTVITDPPCVAAKNISHFLRLNNDVQELCRGDFLCSWSTYIYSAEFIPEHFPHGCILRCHGYSTLSTSEKRESSAISTSPGWYENRSEVSRYDVI